MMNEMKQIVIMLLCLLSITKADAQQFTNGGLEGKAVYGDFDCQGWRNVEYGDPVCVASGSSWATPDLFDRNGPSTSYGMAGIPHSGSTFASGNHAFISGDMFQEGIQQELKGLTPGTTYTITFYQAVIKQNNLRDTSGCWAVYFDKTLIGITEHTMDAAEPSNIHKIWEKRELSFVATSKSHWIKFLPMDDDDDHDSNHGTNGGLRMGIDDISLRAGATIKVTVSAGPIDKILLVENTEMDTIAVNVNDKNGKPVMQAQEIIAANSVVDLTSLTRGTYEIEFKSSKGSYIKEVVIE